MKCHFYHIVFPFSPSQGVRCSGACVEAPSWVRADEGPAPRVRGSQAALPQDALRGGHPVPQGQRHHQRGWDIVRVWRGQFGWVLRRFYGVRVCFFMRFCVCAHVCM